MADSLILTGVKGVSKHTGKELLLTRPKRGGDTHKVKEWWHGTNGVQYVDCTIFDVTANGEVLKLAVASSNGTHVRIDHDGKLNFSFYGAKGVTRAALFTRELGLIEHYVLPTMSGGKVMTVKPKGSAEKPKGPEPKKVAPAQSTKTTPIVNTKPSPVPTVKLSKKSAKKKTED